MNLKIALAICCGAGMLLPKLSHGDDAADQGRPAAERLEFMLSSARDLEAVVRIGESTTELAFHPKPLLRWSNPVGGARDGVVVMWTDAVRPVLLVSVFQSKGGDWIQEFQSLATNPIELSKDERLLWEPPGKSVEFRPVESFPAPADSRSKRLIEMRRIAEQFDAYDDFKSNNVDERHRLRLMPNPLYRYEAEKQGVIDGALFAFVLGTDPELCLLLEARETAAGDRVWEFAFAPMTCWAVEVQRQGKPVWFSGARVGGSAPKDMFFQRIPAPE